MSIKKIMIVGLVLLLASSLFFLPHYLTNKILSGDFNSQQLQFALEHKNTAALSFALIETHLHGKRWLVLAKALAKTQGNIAFQLAKYNESKNKLKQAVIWYQQAIRLKYSAAYVALAQLYFDQLNLLKAQQILDSLLQFNTESSLALTSHPSKKKTLENVQAAILKIKIAIYQGEDKKISRYIDNALVLLKGNSEGQLLLNDIQTFKIQKNINAERIKPFYLGKTCLANLQIFATNLQHLKQAQALVQKFEIEPLANFVCLSTPRYISLSALSCEDNKNIAIQCDESHWQSLASTINTRYIGVMLPEGGANVHLGILYFDAQDSIDVFSHEMSHLLGFIDEYPLPEKHLTCDSMQEIPFSHNIVVLNKSYQGNRAIVRAKILLQIPWAKSIKETTPILQMSVNKKPLNWLLGTPLNFKNEVGLFFAKTCDKNSELNGLGVRSYQPLSISTQLEYFEKKFPVEYLELLQNQFYQFLMPSFHYNIALALFQKGEVEKAKDWLKEAAKREILIKRKDKILQGDF